MAAPSTRISEDPDVLMSPPPDTESTIASLPELDDSPLDAPNAQKSRKSAKLRANPTVRFTKQLAYNAVNKVEDVGIGLLGVTDVVAAAGEGVASTAVSGVGAVGGVVESGVAGALSISKTREVIKPREVDTVKEVDISGTILKDLNRAIEVENMKGTSNAESPLNTPWILMIFPVLPIAFMYTKTAIGIFLPPFINFVMSVWTFFGWRFWFCASILSFLAVIITWNSVKSIGPLRPITMQIDVALIKMQQKLNRQMNKQMPKIYKALDKILPPFKSILAAIDRMLTPKLGYSPLLAINAKLNGWIFDPKIEEIRLDDAQSVTQKMKAKLTKKTKQQKKQQAAVTEKKLDRGRVTVVGEDRIISRDSGGVEYDPQRSTVPSTGDHDVTGEWFEQFFNVEIWLHEVSELHRKYTSVWVEWIYRDMVVDRSVIRDIGSSESWTGFGASFDDYKLTGEVRLPMRADTTKVKGGFLDVPIKLVLKGRDGLPIYGNDGARRYLRTSPPISIIGIMELSALRIGVGADPDGIVRSELLVPLHALEVAQYRAGLLRASTNIVPVDNSSYSYRQMLSPLPNGEWTVRINVFELRNLKGVDTSGSSDPFVSASVMGMTKKTGRLRQTQSCMVNQLLFFSRLCTGLEFEDQKIVIQVMDWNRLGGASKIGMYTLDAKRILELPGRELYRKWFALQDPSGGKRPAGFIKMSLTVIPPGGSPPYHDEHEDTEELSSANLLKNNVLRTPKMSYENWSVHITIGWADMLPRMASLRYRDAIRGFATFNYSGWDECQTQTFTTEAKEVVDLNVGRACRVLPQRRVIWNEEYILPLTIINGRVAQEGISLKLFHRIMPRLQDPFRAHQLIGQVSVSFEELFKNMTTAVVRGDPADGEDEGDRKRKVALMKPRYYNFYGAPDGHADPYDKGISFRGRVLIGVGAKPGDISAPFMRPCPPPPRPKLEFYKMEFIVLRATELSLKDGWSVYAEGRIGLYEFGHTITKAIVQDSCAEWDENCAVSIPNLQFPEDVDQIPDFFVTIWARKPYTVTELEERRAPDARDMSSENQELKTEDAVDEDPGEDKVSPQNPTEAADANSSVAREKVPTLRTENDDDGSSDTQWQPKAFLRLPAKHLICGQKVPRWMFMDYPGNNVLDSGEKAVPGSILMSASLSRHDPTEDTATRDSVPEDRRLSSFTRSEKRPSSFGPLASPARKGTENEVGKSPSKFKSSRVDGPPGVEPHSGTVTTSKSRTYSYPLGQERSYTLRALILQGRDLPAADESGLSDPIVMVSMGDRRQQGESLCKQTVSPLWKEMIEVKDIKIRDGERKPNVNVLIFDDDDTTNSKEVGQYLGRSIINASELDTAVPTLQGAKWYPVFSVNPGVIVGEVLADFQLIPTDDAEKQPIAEYRPPLSTGSSLRISLVGLRDVKLLQYAAGDLYVECRLPGESVKEERSKPGAILQQKAFEANCNILDVMVLAINVPEDLRLAPTLNFHVYARYDHASAVKMVATAAVPLEKWLSEHNRKLLTGESLIDDSFGTDAPIPEKLFSSDRNYQFRRKAKRSGEEPIGAASLRLHELKSHERGEKKNMATLRQKQDVLRIGFSNKNHKNQTTKTEKEEEAKGGGIGEKISAALAPIRAMKYSFAETLADLMPDVSMALGIEVEEDVSLSQLTGVDDSKIDYDGTRKFKNTRGYCPVQLEEDFSEPAYGEFLMFRGDNRSLGNTIGRMADAAQESTITNSALPPLLPLEEAQSSSTVTKKEKRRAVLEGSRLAVGKIKARLDLIEMNKDDENETKKVRLTSLRSFGRIFVPSEVVVRVYILRAINLQQVGSQCNPYLTTKFYGGYPDYYSRKHDPVIDSDNPNFFDMFESRVKMPGGSVRIEVKDRVLPEFIVPLSYPMYIKDDGQSRFGFVQRELPLNVGKLGLGWSVSIGATVIDLDARWYNSAWRSLAKTPVETRSLYSEESANLKGQVEMFVDIFDAKEVDRRPRMFRPIPISKPPQETFELRVVIYKISECSLPYKLANNDPTKLAAFYVQARLGNRAEDEKKTDVCKYVADGVAEFNWRMKWAIQLPSVEIKPRLKLQIFDDTSHGLGDDQLCATADIKLRSLFGEIMSNKKPILKKKQWVLMEHPNYPDVMTRIQISLELTTAELAAKKKCFAGNDAYSDQQHEDYILPRPFQPAAFSLMNPVPYFNYLIVSAVNNIQWQLATFLLVFPFLPMSVQFVFMLTPWHWYAAGGVCGLLVLVRLMMVQAARTARMQTEMDSAKQVAGEPEHM